MSLLFGILAFIMPLRLKRKVIVQQGIWLIAAVVLVFLLGSDGVLSKTDGAIAILTYLTYYIFTWRAYSKHRPGVHPKANILMDVVYGIGGLVLLWFASDLVIMNGIILATDLGVSQSLIGLLFISIGTGLPELSVALSSYHRKSIEISMGDLIGSSICDLLLSLGAGTVISGFLVASINLRFDLPVLLGFCLLVLYFLYTGRRISKRKGLLLIVLFLVYAAIKILVTG